MMSSVCIALWPFWSAPKLVLRSRPRSFLLPRYRGGLRVLRPLGPPLLHLVRLIPCGVELDEPVEVEPGREVVLGRPRRVVAFLVALRIRARVERAVGDLLGVRFQKDQLHAILVQMGEEAAVGTDPLV